MERSRRQRQNVPSIDRLSALPDDVICHILSFLPTKTSASTSILAKRWRLLWAHVPDLDFYESNDHLPGIRFSCFVYKVMFFHQAQSLNTFRLFYKSYVDNHDLETWITIAISRNVKDLDLFFNFYSDMLLPRCLFTCKTLVDLRLSFCQGIPTSGAVSLPSLKRLHLDYITFSVNESLRHLLSGCPVLDELSIRGLTDQSLDYLVLDLDSPTIKRLTLHVLGYLNELLIPKYRVRINAPAVRYLKVSSDYAVGAFDITLDVFSLPLKKFNNLTKIEWATHWVLLTKFLEVADNLEVLIIREVHEDLKRWTKADGQVPQCISSHLKIVTIHQFGCTMDEYDLVRYLLRNGKVLKRLEIYSQHQGIYSNSRCDALPRIIRYTQGSNKCEIVLNGFKE